MGDSSWASSPAVARSMRGNRRRDTSPELAVRRIVFAEGLRYRVDFAPGLNKLRRADIVFTRLRLVFFIDGCFWHGCALHSKPPKTNADYWGPKLGGNMQRDRETDEQLREQGWTVYRFWEHIGSAAIASDIIRLVREAMETAPLSLTA